MIAANHSFHYDSFVLWEAADRLGRPVHFLTAWQVFAMSSRFDRWSLQRHGCFSIDREDNDRQAFKQAVDILKESRYPLVVFPEGDIYHTNDRVMPFREGAAAIAMAAAKRTERRVVIAPCALKCWYVEDPTAELCRLMTRLEERLYWRPRPDLTLPERILRFADGLLVLKEMDHFGTPQAGNPWTRSAALAESILNQLEERYGVMRRLPATPERVKALRQKIIKQMSAVASDDGRTPFRQHMDDLFLVMQLYSYPPNYVTERPTIERIAETLDKFEEDIFEVDVPGVRGSRRVLIRFGEPIELPSERTPRDVPEYTQLTQSRVQALLDEMNGSSAARHTRDRTSAS
jgi:1-acyl-sn-glycerol-3-phosphate acyltransferase